MVSSGRACFFLSGGNATCEGGGCQPLASPLGPQPPSSSASLSFLQNKHPRAQTSHPAKAQMEPELELISPVARATRTWTEDPAFCLSPPPPARPRPCLSWPRPPRPWPHPLHLQQLAVPGGGEDGDI